MQPLSLLSKVNLRIPSSPDTCSVLNTLHIHTHLKVDGREVEDQQGGAWLPLWYMGANGLYWSSILFAICQLRHVGISLSILWNTSDLRLYTICYILVLEQMLVEIIGKFCLFYVVNHCNEVVNFNFLRSNRCKCIIK